MLYNTEKYKNQAGMNYLFIYSYFFDPGTQFPENEKNYALQIQKKYQNQAGINHPSHYYYYYYYCLQYFEAVG